MFVRVLGQAAFHKIQGYTKLVPRSCILFHLLPCGTPHGCSTFCFDGLTFTYAKAAVDKFKG